MQASLPGNGVVLRQAITRSIYRRILTISSGQCFFRVNFQSLSCPMLAKLPRNRISW